MSFNKMWPLVAILVALLMLGLVTKHRPPRVDLARQAGLKALVPADFLAADVATIEIRLAGKAEKDGTEKDATADEVAEQKEKKGDDGALRLVRGEAGAWSIATAWNAAADATKVADFLSKVKTLEGEFRSKSAAVLDDYRLDEKSALHLRFFQKDGKEPWVHLLVGKKSDSGRGFVRRAGSDEVHEVPVDLRAEVGLWSEDKLPEAEHWLKKKFVDFSRSDVKSLVLAYPDKEIRFEKRVKIVASEEKSDATTGTAEKEKKPETVTEWVCTNLPEGLTVTKTAASDVLRGLADLQATGVVDPARAAEWGFDAPELSAELELDGKTIVLRGHRIEPGGDAYFRIEGSPQIYRVGQWNVEKAFPKAETLFGKVDQVNARESDLVEVEVRKDGKTLRMRRQDDKSWKLVEPADAAVDAGKLSDIGWGISALKVEDMALVDGADLGLAEATRSLRYTLSDGQSTVWVLGKSSPFVKGVYARRSGSDRILVLNQGAVDRAMKTADELPPRAEPPKITPKAPAGE